MTANRPYDDEGVYTERRADPDRADREISLGTPTILGIFFALAVAFAAVFGIGYTMGHKSAQSAQTTATDPTSGVTVSSNKPAAGSLIAQPIIRPTQPVADVPASPVPVETATVSLNSPAKSTANPVDATIVGDKHPAPAPQPATANLQPATGYVVQVAAVTSQDVADILLSSLQKKGYTVAVHHEPQDKLLHVQIGPFADKKEAEAMRARVLADGFNAIVK
jgi:DedD protein